MQVGGCWFDSFYAGVHHTNKASPLKKKKRGVASRKGTENEWNRTLDSLLTLAADIDLFCSFRAVMLLCQQVSVLKEEL